MERVLLTTGGTGGHIFPALAVAEEIVRRNPRAMVLFMGGLYGPEADIVAKAGFDFVGLPVRGVIGRGLRGAVAAVGMGRGILRAMRVIRKVRPQYVLGFGGYASFAGVLAARLCHVPAAIHEQNALPGKSNRILSRLVDKVFLSLPDAGGAFPPEKAELVGNPVRAAIQALYADAVPGDAGEAEEAGIRACTGSDAPDALTANADRRVRNLHLLVMGGSQGARAINDGIAAALPQLARRGVEIWHQTGLAEYERVRGLYRDAGAERVRVEAFIDDMGAAYAWADLAVSRAGGSSIAELTVAGVPALLIPFPFATHDHQLHNARALESAGGAMVLEQKEIVPPTGSNQALVDAVLALAADGGRLRLMGERCRAVARPGAAAAIVDSMEGACAACRH